MDSLTDKGYKKRTLQKFAKHLTEPLTPLWGTMGCPARHFGLAKQVNKPRKCVESGMRCFANFGLGKGRSFEKCVFRI